MATTFRGGAALCALAALCATAFAAPIPSATKTIPNLKEAYKGETTAQSKYASYARQADKEGYKGVASLFRAASRAESFHARNHKAALAALGVKDATPGRFTAKPGATRANLQDAVKGETYERDSMYPRMLREASQEKQRGASRSLRYAREAEGQHAALYTAALKDLSKSQQAQALYVCPVCGATYKGTAPAACVVCGTSRDKFKATR